MDNEETGFIDDFLSRVRAFRVSAAVGPQTGWDPNAPAIEPWHEKYPRLHIPQFIRAYEMDRDQIAEAMRGHPFSEAIVLRVTRDVLRRQFRDWLRGEGVSEGDLDAMVAAYDVNPLAGLNVFPVK
jgi:hypothetical protein